MQFEFKLDHNAVEVTKNNCCVKGEGKIDHSIVTRLLKKFCLSWKNLNNHVRLDRPKTVDSKAVL